VTNLGSAKTRKGRLHFQADVIGGD